MGKFGTQKSNHGWLVHHLNQSMAEDDNVGFSVVEGTDFLTPLSWAWTILDGGVVFFSPCITLGMPFCAMCDVWAGNLEATAFMFVMDYQMDFIVTSATPKVC